MSATAEQFAVYQADIEELAAIDRRVDEALARAMEIMRERKAKLAEMRQRGVNSPLVQDVANDRGALLRAAHAAGIDTVYAVPKETLEQADRRRLSVGRAALCTF